MIPIFSSVTFLSVLAIVKCASYQRYGETTSGYGVGYSGYGIGNGLGVTNGLGSYGVTNGYGSSYGSGYGSSGASSSYGYGSSGYGYPSSTSVPYRSSTYGSLGVSDSSRYPNYSPGYSTTRQPYNYNSYSTSGSGNLYSSSGSNGYNLQRYGEKYGSTGYGSTGLGTSGYGTAGYGSSGYGGSGLGSSGYGLGSSGYGLGSSGLGSSGLGSSGYGSSSGYGATGLSSGYGSSRYGSNGLGGIGYGSRGLGSSGYGSSGYGSTGYGSSNYGSSGLGSSMYGSSMSGGYGSGGYNSYETPFMRDIGGCMNRSPMSQVFVESLMGMWYGVEVIQHMGFDFRREYEYERTCIVMHLSEPLDRPSTENQLYHVAALSAKFRQTHRHLRLLWDENGNTIEYPLYFRNESAGYWHVLGNQNGTLGQRSNYQQFTGTVQVLSATYDHLVLNFCQEADGGRPAQLYSVFFSRNPAEISSWELDSVHAMLQGKKLSIASRRMVCGNNGADRAIQGVFLSLVACFFAYIIGSS